MYARTKITLNPFRYLVVYTVAVNKSSRSVFAVRLQYGETVYVIQNSSRYTEVNIVQ